MTFAYVMIALVMFGFIVVFWWALYKLFMSQRHPKVRVKGGYLYLGSGGQAVKQEIAGIDHFLVVTTHYFSAGGNTLKRVLFAVDPTENRNLLYSRDPVNMLSGNCQDFLDTVESATSKSIERKDLVEDLDGRVYTLDEFKAKQKDDIWKDMVRVTGQTEVSK